MKAEIIWRDIKAAAWSEEKWLSSRDVAACRGDVNLAQVVTLSHENSKARTHLEVSRVLNFNCKEGGCQHPPTRE